ncbi:MAG TPA: UDP-N-acetylglucosamine 1-carboxyvinyltransferase [Alphaproteobacteria bacterium]|nr:UDP-N-acetylglucosamine 1-carboxyvinyltransferase [Alphaproteobacteria bacterium]
MTSTYTVTGGRPVRGEITCYGAKNFINKALVAACLGDSPTTLTNVPPIGEVQILVEMVQGLGAKVAWDKKAGTLEVDPTSIKDWHMKMPDSGSNRIPILFIPVLLHRFGKARVPVLDGDAIGARKVDFHIEAGRLFGARVEHEEGGFFAEAGGLKAIHYSLSYPSVGATESCLLYSVLAAGTTIIRNAAIEPEILALIAMLRAMGAIIFVTPGREIRVQGVTHLHGTTMHCLGDRIEAASWASLACATGGDITVHGIQPDTLNNFLAYYRQVGGGFDLVGEQSLRFYREGELKPIMLETDVYPGFATDWQQPFAVLLTQAQGVSVIHETVYESRFGYTGVLNRMGAKIQVSTECIGKPCRFEHKGHGHSALIMGATPLKGLDAPVEVPDLRAGLAYIIAAAVGNGSTTLTHIDRIERGYGDVAARLSGMNLAIEKR